MLGYQKLMYTVVHFCQGNEYMIDVVRVKLYMYLEECMQFGFKILISLLHYYAATLPYSAITR